MTEFRTPEQIQTIYNERAELGKDDQPYVLEYESDASQLIFFGSVHSNDPDQSQWAVLDEAWQKFLNHKNDKKMVFYEGNHPQTVEGLTEDEALRQFGESGVILYRANQAGITAESPEPERKSEINYLREKFSIPEIVTYYFARQMHQWVRQDKEHQPQWEPYARQFAEKLESLAVWDGQEIKLGQVFAWFRQTTHKSFEPHDEKLLYNQSDPSQSPVSAASGQYRDEKLLEAIKSKWQAGVDSFIVYGSGHAIRLEPALEKLTSQNWGEL